MKSRQAVALCPHGGAAVFASLRGITDLATGAVVTGGAQASLFHYRAAVLARGWKVTQVGGGRQTWEMAPVPGSPHWRRDPGDWFYPHLNSGESTPSNPPHQERTPESGEGVEVCPPRQNLALTGAQGTRPPPREGKSGTGTHRVTLPLEGRWGPPHGHPRLGMMSMCQRQLGGPSSSKRTFQWTGKARKSPPPKGFFRGGGKGVGERGESGMMPTGWQSLRLVPLLPDTAPKGMKRRRKKKQPNSIIIIINTRRSRKPWSD